MTSILKAFLENETALKRFLKRYCASAQEIEDVAQETFLRAFAAESAKVVVHAPKAFLFTVAKNLALNERARHSNAITDSLEDFGGPAVLIGATQDSADNHVEARQRLRLLARAVATLPPQCARVFMLRKVHGISQKEIAQRLGISISTVEKHVVSGFSRVRAYLAAHGEAAADKGPPPRFSRPGALTTGPRESERSVRDNVSDE